MLQKHKTNSRYKFLLLGVIRNGGYALAENIKTIEESFSRYGSVDWFVVESDSDDETVQNLTLLSDAKPNFRFLSMGKLRDRHPQRTERISIARNRYLQELRNFSEYQNVDYVVVADLDGVNGQLSEAAIRSCWVDSPDWDVCCANQLAPYYDIWALRHREWSPNDCQIQYKFLVKNGFSAERALQVAVFGRMIRVAPARDWIEVDSAFGGLAIYRRQVLNSLIYKGLDSDGNEVCEHVSLHQQIKERGGRIFINPRFINGGWNEHSREMKMTQRILRSVRRSVPQLIRRLYLEYRKN